MKCALTHEQHQMIANQLYEAEKTNTPILQLTKTYDGINQEDAYAIQQIGMNRRVEEDGARIIGRKIGLTSRGMMEMLNCDSPDYGYLLDSGLLYSGEVIDTAKMNIPMIEAELCLVMGSDIQGPGVTPAQVINAVEWVMPCFEIPDGRYPSWDITVIDTISDDAGAGKYLLSTQVKRINEINPECIGMVMYKNGELFGSACGAEVLGSPVNSAAWLINKLAEYGAGLKRGDIVLTGAFMKADLAKAGDIYSMQMDGFSALTVKFA